MRIPLLCMVMVMLGSCTIGPRVRDYPLAHSPAGVDITVEIQRRQHYMGELIAVRDTSFIMRRGEALYEIPYSAMRRAETQASPRVQVTGGGPVPASVRARLSSMSRYPQGLSPALLQALLNAYGQERLRGAGEL